MRLTPQQNHKAQRIDNIPPQFIQNSSDEVDGLVKASDSTNSLNEVQKRYLETDFKRKINHRWVMLENGAGRGGGGTIYCRPSPHGSLQGYYVLDYLTSTRYELPGSFPEISSKIYSRLYESFPLLARSYREFLTSFYGISDQRREQDSTPKRSWYPKDRLAYFTDDELKEVDLRALSTLPQECFSNGKLNLRQTVVRDRILNESLRDHVSYYYDTSIIEEFFDKKPLQLSYLLTHEWLRDFIKSASILRGLNSMLHSREFFELSPHELKKRLKELGKGDYKWQNVHDLFQTREEAYSLIANSISIYKVDKIDLEELQSRCVMLEYWNQLTMMDEKIRQSEDECKIWHDENISRILTKDKTYNEVSKSVNSGELEDSMLTNCYSSKLFLESWNLKQRWRALMSKEGFDKDLAKSISPSCF